MRAIGRWAPLMLLLAAACNGKSAAPVIVASSYARVCASSSDCGPIFEGPLDCCSRYRCPNAAIRLDAFPLYHGDLAGAPTSCGVQECAIPPCGGLLTCPAGTCEFHAFDEEDSAKPQLTVGAADYGKACQDLVDCVPVYEGPIGCCGIGCPNAVISQTDLARYTSDVRERTPVCFPPLHCPALPPCLGGRVSCDDGVCRLHDPTSE